MATINELFIQMDKYVKEATKVAEQALIFKAKYEQLQAENEELKEKIKVLELAADLTVYTKEQLSENEKLRKVLEKIKITAAKMQRKCYEGSGVLVMKSRAISIQVDADQALKEHNGK